MAFNGTIRACNGYYLCEREGGSQLWETILLMKPMVKRGSPSLGNLRLGRSISFVE